MDLSSYFESIAALVPLIMLVAGKLISVTNSKGTIAQMITWIVGPILAFIGAYLDWGIFAQIGPLWTIIFGMGAALVANGVASNDIVKMILEWLKLKVPSDA